MRQPLQERKDGPRMTPEEHNHRSNIEALGLPEDRRPRNHGVISVPRL